MQATWMLLASALFTLMGVCVKVASAHFNAAELVFWRGVVGVLFMWVLARSRGVNLATRVPGMHAWRATVGTVSLGAWFYAIGHLPLATAMTLNYMSSVWVAVFLVSSTLLAWRPGESTAFQGPLVLSVLAGFAGVVLMLRPTIAQDQLFAGLLGLLSGMTAAFAYLQVMALGRAGEPETRTVFYFAVGTVLAGGLGMAVVGVSAWDWTASLWLLPIGLLASLGQLCMTRAYSKGATLVVANLQYSGIIFAALLGLVWFGEALDLLAWSGMALIICSGIVSTVLRQRAAPKAPADEH